MSRTGRRGTPIPAFAGNLLARSSEQVRLWRRQDVTTSSEELSFPLVAPRKVRSRLPASGSSPSCRCDRTSAGPSSFPSFRSQRSCPPRESISAAMIFSKTFSLPRISWPWCFRGCCSSLRLRHAGRKFWKSCSFSPCLISSLRLSSLPCSFSSKIRCLLDSSQLYGRRANDAQTFLDEHSRFRTTRSGVRPEDAPADRRSSSKRRKPAHL